jgi:hypothetical protein
MTISRSIGTSLLYLNTCPVVCLQWTRPSRRVMGIAMIFVSFGWLSGCCGVRMTGGGCGCGIAVMHSTGGCDSVCDSGCDAAGCGAAPCGGCSTHFNSQIAARMRTGLFGGCTSGCGEVYCDEHINEPPTCDPCGMNGEFVGGGCGPCRPLLHRIRDMMGTPFLAGCDSCGVSSGCDSCSGGCSTQYSEQTGGYCSNCKDGTAGNPQSYSHHSSHSQGHVHSNILPSPANGPANGPTPAPRADNSLLTEPAPANLQPIPDAAADSLPPSGSAPPIPSANRGTRSMMKASSNSRVQGKAIPASTRRVQPKLVTR